MNQPIKQPINNRLVNEYQQHMTNRNVYMNNQILQNNPLYQGSINNPMFHQKMMMYKNQYKQNRPQNIKELKMSKEQIYDVIINPIKVEKITKNEFTEKLSELQSKYITYKTKNKNKNIVYETDAVIPKEINNWWNTRTNTPYKNILKKENYSKRFDKLDDFIVHKVTKFDKDKARLKKEFNEILEKLEIHDNELKLIYSPDEENKYKEKFEYINKYKYRLKYDPKDYDKLKQYYKKEQKKISRDIERIDYMIEMMVSTEDLSEKERKELEEYKAKYDKSSDDSDSDNDVDELFEKGKEKLEKQLEKQLEKELKKELGYKEYEKIMKKHNLTNTNDSNNKNKSTDKLYEKYRNKMIKPQTDSIEDNIKPTIKTNQNNKSKNEDALYEKYKKKIMK